MDLDCFNYFDRIQTLAYIISLNFPNNTEWENWFLAERIINTNRLT